MNELQAYLLGALRVANDARAGRIMPDYPRADRLRVARAVIRWARCAVRLGRLLTADEKMHVINRDLQPWELCP